MYPGRLPGRWLREERIFGSSFAKIRCNQVRVSDGYQFKRRRRRKKKDFSLVAEACDRRPVYPGVVFVSPDYA